MTNLYAPNSIVVQNPYQRRVEYGDISELAGQIAAAYDQYPDSRGVMQVPRGRVVDRTTGEPVDIGGFMGITHGVTLPKHYQSGYKIELLYGHRRLEALRWLEEHDERYRDGLVMIDVTFATDEQMLDAVWAENAQRRNLSAVEEARLMSDALAALSNGSKYTQSALARRWGIAQPTVANRLRLLQLPEEVQAANQQGIISERVAMALLDVQKFIDAKTEVTGYVSITPKALMQSALEGNATSNKIRLTIDAWLKFASKLLPEMVDTPINAPDVVQEKCRGCPFQMSDNDRRCINNACFKRKARAVATKQAEALANELVLEYQHDAYIADEIKYWSKSSSRYMALCDALNNHLDLIGEHIIVTANLEDNYILLPAWSDGRWRMGHGKRYSVVATSRLKIDELMALLPKETAETHVDTAIDLEAQPLAARWDWYKKRKATAVDKAAVAIETFIGRGVESLPAAALDLFCRVLDVQTTDTPEVNEARLAEGIYKAFRKDIPAWVAERIGLDATNLSREQAEAMTVATLAEYIDETKNHGPFGYEKRRYAPHLVTCRRYCEAHNIRGDVWNDLLVAWEQCELAENARL
ncbi:MAG: hypothetical protein KDD89_01480 [Anaerolineales bacterium]|nr:hypothetical protein [Anaerolineales bacterium]